MYKPKILVTGATGKTGSAVVSELLAKGWPVRALVRKQDARAEQLARRGAEIAVADLFETEQLRSAMRDTERAYFLPVYDPRILESVTAFADAAREAKLEAIAGMSQWLASPNHLSFLTRAHWDADHILASIPGTAYIKINPGYFADNYLRLIDVAAHLGVLPNLTGDSRNAPPSNEDIARVAAVVLMDPQKHAGKSYRPTAPKLLSTREMTDIFSRVLGRKVRLATTPVGLFLKAARLDGVGPFELSSLPYYVQDHLQGAFEFCAPTDDVLKVTGRPAEDFEVTAVRYAALPKAQRTLANRVRAWFGFLRTPLSFGFNNARYEREMGFKAPAQPLFAMQDEGWKRERMAQFQGWNPVAAGGDVDGGTVSGDHRGGESAKTDMPPSSEMSSSQSGTRVVLA